MSRSNLLATLTFAVIGSVSAGAIAESFDEKLHAPDFEAQSLNTSERKLRLSDASGEVVLLNFWASWCPPCREEMPHFQKIFDRFKDEGLTIMAVAVHDELEASTAFLDEHEFTFPVLFDHAGEAAAAYRVSALPQTYLIGRDGVLIQTPNPKTGERTYRISDPAVWEHEDTYRFIETLVKSKTND